MRDRVTARIFAGSGRAAAYQRQLRNEATRVRRAKRVPER
jgi:hypothetical protein